MVGSAVSASFSASSACSIHSRRRSSNLAFGVFMTVLPFDRFSCSRNKALLAGSFREPFGRSLSVLSAVFLRGDPLRRAGSEIRALRLRDRHDLVAEEIIIVLGATQFGHGP